MGWFAVGDGNNAARGAGGGGMLVRQSESAKQAKLTKPLGGLLIFSSLKILTPPIETPDPPDDTPKRASEQVTTWHPMTSQKFLRVGKIKV